MRVLIALVAAMCAAFGLAASAAAGGGTHPSAHGRLLHAVANTNQSSNWFGYVQGTLDHRMTSRGGEPAVEFSWEGGDAADGTPLTGRGWGVLKDDELQGEFLIHDGDDSEFVAKR